MINRRLFLQRMGLGLTAATLGPALAPKVAWAADTKSHYFIFCYFEGGWDHLLGLDPRDPLAFPDDPTSVALTGIEPGYTRLQGDFPSAPINAGPFILGPAARPLVPIADRLAIVRGINMATLTHEVGRRYFITGQPPSGTLARGASVAAIAAAQLGDDRPVPNLAHRVETYAAGLPAFASAMNIGAVDHLRYVLRDTLGIPTPVPASAESALAAYRAARLQSPGGSVIDSDAGRLYMDHLDRARALVAGDSWSAFDFSSGSAETAAARAHYGLDAVGLETPWGRAALAGQALKSGLSRVVSVALSTNLDTHETDWARDHAPRLEAGFDALARLITDLETTEAPEGGSYWDHTTLVAFSEFGRQGTLNSRNGRDHLLTNCALLAGAGIKGGTVFGASSDNALGPALVDLATGSTNADGGTSLAPAHILSTALVAGGLDATELRAPALAPLLTKK